MAAEMVIKPLSEFTDEELARSFSIAVDVDGTLILWPGPDPGSPGTGAPSFNMPLIKRLWDWKQADGRRDLTVWSGMGKAHAMEVVSALERLGFPGFADHIMAKPTVMFDDAPGWFDPQTMVDVRK